MSPIDKQEHSKLVKLGGKACNGEDDGGGGGDVVDHREPDPSVPLADLNHLKNLLKKIIKKVLKRTLLKRVLKKCSTCSTISSSLRMGNLVVR